MLAPGSAIEGKYEILTKLKEGGMGAIYVVRHRLLGELRVVKVMRPQLADSEDDRKRFMREAQTATRLKHQNIATLHDFVVDDDGTFYMVLEYIEGINLRDLIRTNGPPPVPLAVEFLRQSLAALGYLHRRGVIHRDLSPDNLMMSRDDSGMPIVKLIDLGIAKTLGSKEELTAAGVFMGKLRYCSPEQLRGASSSDVDTRSDLYSMGVVLYELLTGKSPFPGEGMQEILRSRLSRPPLLFEETDIRGRVSESLRVAVRRALEAEPEKRYQNADEFIEALDAAAGREMSRSAKHEIDAYVTPAFKEIAEKSFATTTGSTMQREINARFGSMTPSRAREGGTPLPGTPPGRSTPPAQPGRSGAVPAAPAEPTRTVGKTGGTAGTAPTRAFLTRPREQVTFPTTPVRDEVPAQETISSPSDSETHATSWTVTRRAQPEPAAPLPRPAELPFWVKGTLGGAILVLVVSAWLAFHGLGRKPPGHEEPPKQSVRAPEPASQPATAAPANLPPLDAGPATTEHAASALPTVPPLAAAEARPAPDRPLAEPTRALEPPRAAPPPPAPRVAAQDPGSRPQRKPPEKPVQVAQLQLPTAVPAREHAPAGSAATVDIPSGGFTGRYCAVVVPASLSSFVQGKVKEKPVGFSTDSKEYFEAPRPDAARIGIDITVTPSEIGEGQAFVVTGRIVNGGDTDLSIQSIEESAAREATSFQPLRSARLPMRVEMGATPVIFQFHGSLTSGSQYTKELRFTDDNGDMWMRTVRVRPCQ
jgi:eukaryotic-like serine/threonine-protein kinase